MHHDFKYAVVAFLLVTGSVSGRLAAEDAFVELAGWIKASGGSAEDLVAWPELLVEEGKAFEAKEAVYLKLYAWPASNRVTFPRLNNPTKKVFLLGKPDEELKLTPEPSEWRVDLPKVKPDAAHAVVVVQTIGEPHLPLEPESVSADDKGVFVLSAHKSLTHGEMLRYEPQPHKNTVGYWTKPADWAQWQLDVARGGKYKLHVLQGCGTGQGGSVVGIHIRQSSDALSKPAIRFEVEDTGHFQNFVTRELGEIELKTPGQYTLELRPERLANKAVMDVREVRLVPVSGTEGER